MKFIVSVIIPVYNAEQFINEAVESALRQPETGEVLLIEDGSSDKSLLICQDLAERYQVVRLLRHPGGVNKGAAATRNLGMHNAQFDFIAFIDADDFFLPNRFSVTKKVFESYTDCDGVYEAVGTAYTDKKSEALWRASNETANELTSLRDHVLPGDLFKRLIKRGAASIQVDGLTIKRSALKKSGYMNEELGTMGEDIDFILRLSGVCLLRPGRMLEPVAMRRVHPGSSFWRRGSQANKYYGTLKVYKTTYNWFDDHNYSNYADLILNKQIIRSMSSQHFDNNFSRFVPAPIIQRFRLLLLIFEFPHVVTKSFYWKNFLPVRFQRKSS